MTTLRDVAKASGLSTTTVNRALRGFSDVTEKTRRHVETIARAMNYVPNQAARKLVSGRSGMVGLVLKRPPQPLEYGHFVEFVASLSQAFSKRDLDFVLHIGDGSDILATHERLIGRGALDGYVLLFPITDDPRVDFLLERDVPFVVHGHQQGEARYAYFDTDNHAASVIAVDLLFGLGHRRIVNLAGPVSWPSVAARVQGHHDAMAAHGLPADPGLIVHGDTSHAYGAKAAAALFADAAHRPTAIICCNSLVAAGVYDAARAHGLSIPGDLSVVAHDDVLPQVQTDMLDPPLTVTRLALRDAADPLAGLLVRRLAGEPVLTLQVKQKPALIERGSVARPRR